MGAPLMLLVDIILEWLNRLVASAGPHPKPVIRPRTVVVTVPEENLAIKVVLETELSRGEHFVNHHGITTENLSSVLVDPFLVWVDPDDLETQPRAMWVVLQKLRTRFPTLITQSLNEPEYCYTLPDFLLQSVFV